MTNLSYAPLQPNDVTQPYAKLVQIIAPGSTLCRAWQLTGGASAQVTALEVLQVDGRIHRMVLRQHGEADRAQNPNIAADEFRLLQNLQSVGLPTPAPYYLDQSGEIFAIPYLVIEFIEGKPDFAPANIDDFVDQFAAQLAHIHNANSANADLTFLPQQANIVTQKLRQHPATLDESLDEGLIRRTLAAVWPLMPRNPPTLLHGDYWPGNVMWQHGQLVAVIDWEDAAFGEPLADVANARLEVLWAFGPAAMQRFTAAYRSQSPIDFSHLLYWDLYAALRPAGKLADWGLDAEAEQNMRVQHHWFVRETMLK